MEGIREKFATKSVFSDKLNCANMTNPAPLPPVSQPTASPRGAQGDLSRSWAICALSRDLWAKVAKIRETSEVSVTETRDLTIALPLAGAMGAALGVRLTGAGYRVVTCVAGRSDATRARAKVAGMIPVRLPEIAEADVILSVVPPGIAQSLAEEIAGHIPAGHRPLFIEMNAISPARAREIGERIAVTGARYLDGSIIGLPPAKDHTGRSVIYLSGLEAAGVAVSELGWFTEAGLAHRIIEGGIGAASALKMCYGALTKGRTALLAAIVSAAEKAGIGAELYAELTVSQPAILRQGQSALPRMYNKAYRWGDEMREIAAFLTPEASAEIWTALGGFYDEFAEDVAGEGVAPARIDRFLARQQDET